MTVADLQALGTVEGLNLSTLKDLSPEGTNRKIYTVIVPGASAMSIWKKMRSAVDRTGYWPVIAGSPVDFRSRDLKTLLEKLHDIPAFIERGSGIDVDNWLDHAMLPMKFSEQEVEPAVGIAMHRALGIYANDTSIAGLNRFEDTAKDLGVNPAGWLGGEYTCLHCPEVEIKATSEEDIIGYKNILTNKPLEEVVMLLVPTKTPWEVSAYLNVGYGHQHHEPHEHFAIHKYWNENYGAEIVSSTNDAVEMIVARPPHSMTEALKLAQQQFVYAPDIVKHGTGKTSALASQLLLGHSWYFWWD